MLPMIITDHFLKKYSTVFLFAKTVRCFQDLHNVSADSEFKTIQILSSLSVFFSAYNLFLTLKGYQRIHLYDSFLACVWCMGIVDDLNCIDVLSHLG